MTDPAAASSLNPLTAPLRRVGIPLNPRLPTVVWFVCVALITGAFLLTAATDLADYPTLHGDESWIMSAAFKWSEDGVFGSDMFAGFFGAEEAYFIALPFQHALIAASFRHFGAGILQARLPSLLAATLGVWLVAYMARRWGGILAGILAPLFLVVWRSGLTGGDLQLPWLQRAQSARYDMLAVTLLWLAIALSILCTSRHRTVLSFVAGLSAGMSALTQFFGLFAIPLALLLVADAQARKQHWAGLIAGAGLPLLTYAYYAWDHWDEFVGQAILKGPRLQFGQAGFYFNNILTEVDRFRSILRVPTLNKTIWDPSYVPLGPWLMVLTMPLAVYAIWKFAPEAARRDKKHLLLTLTIPWIGLALFEQSKAQLYYLVLVPAISILLGWGMANLFSWMETHRTGVGPLATRIGLSLLVTVVLLEGVLSYTRHLQLAKGTRSYASAAQPIRDQLPEASPVLGAERWWWALHDRRYTAFNNLRYRWEAAYTSEGQADDIGELMAEFEVEFVLLDAYLHGELASAQPDFRRRFEAYIASHKQETTHFFSPSYGHLVLVELSTPHGP